MWRPVALALLAITAAVHSQAAEPASLRFDEVFSTKGEPRSVHFRAQFASRGEPHVLEVWREGDTRLTRRTDNATELHVLRQPENPDYEMVVLDLPRKLETKIARDDLYRLGNFTDWFDLAHGLRHPASTYRLTAMATPAAAPKPIQPCRWFALEQSARTTRICWSASAHLPMLMLGGRDEVLWQLTELSLKPNSASVFEIHDADFIRNDAHRDLNED